MGDRMTRPAMQRGAFGMPKPQGWTLERAVHLLAGSVVLASLLLGQKYSPRWRVLTIASRGLVDFGSDVVYVLRSTSHVER